VTAAKSFGLAGYPRYDSGGNRSGEAQPHVAKRRLKRVFEAGAFRIQAHLYYPSRRHSSPAFALRVDALRYAREHGGSASVKFSTTNPAVIRLA
jgi:hypothetical protein